MNHDLPPSGALPLTDWGLIRASGDDARSFLHGQLTQDMLHLEPGRARLAGYCSAKGRLLASFVVWLDGNGDVLLACSADLLPATLKRLSMFVLRAKCKLSDASAERPLWGLVGGAVPAGPAWAVQDHRIVRLPEVRGLPRALCLGEPPAAPALDPELWRWLEVHSGMARIVGATVEAFVPQMVNLELVGGVNFQKGCYPGQEIVARSQYRGTLKRRLQVFETDAPAAVGQEIFHSADPEQPAGVVAGSGMRDGRTVIAAEIKLVALEGGSLHLGQAGGATLTPLPLPYEIPPQD